MNLARLRTMQHRSCRRREWMICVARVRPVAADEYAPSPDGTADTAAWLRDSRARYLNDTVTDGLPGRPW